METLYNRNGLVFWTEREIRIRNMVVDYLVAELRAALKQENRAWELVQVEAPILTPVSQINKNYDSNNIYIPAQMAFNDVPIFDDVALRPETTMGSYRYALWLQEHQTLKLPLCVWQHGKSFRREQDQVTKNMRLKEFYQLEFQCIYGLTTKNDYALAIVPGVRRMISDLIGPCRVEKSDRLPDYSEETVDVVCEANNMEVVSISKRKDFPDAKVLEVAVGTDRCVYNFLLKSGFTIPE